MTVTSMEKTIIAVPVTDERRCSHFGHCQQFALYDVDLHQRQVESSRRLDPPPHEPGLLPLWLSKQRARVVGPVIVDVMKGPVSRLPAAGESVVGGQGRAVSGAAGAGSAATVTNSGPRA